MEGFPLKWAGRVNSGKREIEVNSNKRFDLTGQKKPVIIPLLR
jgi:hypothetical protein